eukprot:CAMPEP_0174250660 /NCGR_PEP_ID=MMETSP0439-20130205/768_1 /TAXON_ID=0 /ORGANISM="Stereomyxa ramosa, Strain Chinc5" /LENGTH=262 /DNA_ID=CAMNT_0015330791 /DNA_START=62 /DNA_END=847 /DNA_ORIENTATION=+
MVSLYHDVKGMNEFIYQVGEEVGMLRESIEEDLVANGSKWAEAFSRRTDVHMCAFLAMLRWFLLNLILVLATLGIFFYPFPNIWCNLGVLVLGFAISFFCIGRCPAVPDPSVCNFWPETKPKKDEKEKEIDEEEELDTDTETDQLPLEKSTQEEQNILATFSMRTAMAENLTKPFKLQHMSEILIQCVETKEYLSIDSSWHVYGNPDKSTATRWTLLFITGGHGLLHNGTILNVSGNGYNWKLSWSGWLTSGSDGTGAYEQW